MVFAPLWSRSPIEQIHRASDNTINTDYHHYRAQDAVDNPNATYVDVITQYIYHCGDEEPP